MVKVISNTGLAATFRTVGNAATGHNIFSIHNAASSNTLVGVRRLVVQLDTTTALTVVMPLVKTSRPTALPTDGTPLTKLQFNPVTDTANSNVVLLGATASDGGTATSITANPGATVWQQYDMRMHTSTSASTGQVQAPDNPLLPALVEDTPFILREDEALLVRVVASAGSSNPATNHWFVQCVWEEFTNV
jgi:hypothetical protein